MCTWEEIRHVLIILRIFLLVYSYLFALSCLSQVKKLLIPRFQIQNKVCVGWGGGGVQLAVNECLGKCKIKMLSTWIVLHSHPKYFKSGIFERQFKRRHFTNVGD